MPDSSEEKETRKELVYEFLIDAGKRISVRTESFSLLISIKAVDFTPWLARTQSTSARWGNPKIFSKILKKFQQNYEIIVTVLLLGV